MPSSIIQRSFAGGELGPSLSARADQAKYASGARTVRNFVVMRSGGVTNRAGTYMLEATKANAARFLKFVFNDAQTYVIEAGAGYFRFYRNGARIVVSGVSAWNSGTAYAVGDLASRMGLNYYCTVAHTNQQPPNGAYWHALTGDIYEIPTPYLAGDLAMLKTSQSGDVVTITRQGYKPRELARAGHTAWTLTEFVISPSIAAPTGLAHNGTAYASGIKYGYSVTAVDAVTGEESFAAANVYTGALGTAGSPVQVTWNAVAGARAYRVYSGYNSAGASYPPEWNARKAEVTATTYDDAGSAWLIAPDGDYFRSPSANDVFPTSDDYPACSAYYQQRLVFGNVPANVERVRGSRVGSYHNFGVSNPVQDDDAVTFVIAGNTVQEVRHLLSLDRLVVMTAGGEWVVKGGGEAGALTPSAVNPGFQSGHGSSDVAPVVIGDAVLFLQARASIIRDIFFSFNGGRSESRDLTVFAPHLFEGHTITRLDYAQIPHSVAWAVRSDGVLLGLTYLREQEIYGWHRHDTEGGTFDDVCVVPEGNEDAVYVLVTRNGVQYVERFQSRQCRPLPASTDRDRYFAEDAFFVDAGLTYNGWEWAEALAQTVTLSTGDGWTAGEGLTLTASGGAPFSADEVGNAIDVDMRAAYPSTGAAARLRLTIVGYTSATVVTVESSIDVPAALQNTAITTWARAVDRVEGLDHLIGETVTVLADGNTIGHSGVVDEDGGIDLDAPAAVVHVGLPITADLETLDLDIANTSVRNRQKRVVQVDLIVQDSRGIMVGPDEDHLEERAPDLDDENEERIPTVTGLVTIPIVNTWRHSGRVVVRQTDPLPLTVLGLIPVGDIGG